MSTFQYHPDIVDRYPNVVGGVILAQGMTNTPTPERLLSAYQAEQQAVLQRLGKTPLSQIPSLSAWRSAFRGFGVDPTQYRSAAEALLRRLTKKGDIPSINTLVDLGNLVSIRYALPTAVFDTRALQGPVTVHFAKGSERYTTLLQYPQTDQKMHPRPTSSPHASVYTREPEGSIELAPGRGEVEHPKPGEVVFSDATELVIARRWCWRQSEQSAAQLDTTNAIITVEAHHAEGRRDIEAALQDLLELLRKYVGGTYTSGLLDVHNTVISD